MADGVGYAEFVAHHLTVCRAGRARKYDARKRKVTLHTLAYSRRKCARHLWLSRRRAKRPRELRASSHGGG